MIGVIRAMNARKKIVWSDAPHGKNGYIANGMKCADRKNVFPNDDWTEEDYEHFKAVVEALEQMCLIKEMHKS